MKEFFRYFFGAGEQVGGKCIQVLDLVFGKLNHKENTVSC